MGSTGSGKFSTYSHKGAGGNGEEKKGLVDEVTGNICSKSIESIILEDVETLPYFENTNGVPGVGEEIFLHNEKYRGRLVVRHRGTGYVLGNLPVDYNYLLACLQTGYEYYGTVLSSVSHPIKRIVVNLNAAH